MGQNTILRRQTKTKRSNHNASRRQNRLRNLLQRNRSIQRTRRTRPIQRRTKLHRNTKKTRLAQTRTKRRAKQTTRTIKPTQNSINLLTQPPLFHILPAQSQRAGRLAWLGCRPYNTQTIRKAEVAGPSPARPTPTHSPNRRSPSSISFFLNSKCNFLLNALILSQPNHQTTPTSSRQFSTNRPTPQSQVHQLIINFT